MKYNLVSVSAKIGDNKLTGTEYSARSVFEPLLRQQQWGVQ